MTGTAASTTACAVPAPSEPIDAIRAAVSSTSPPEESWHGEPGDGSARVREHDEGHEGAALPEQVAHEREHRALSGDRQLGRRHIRRSDELLGARLAQEVAASPGAQALERVAGEGRAQALRDLGGPSVGTAGGLGFGRGPSGVLGRGACPERVGIAGHSTARIPITCHASAPVGGHHRTTGAVAVDWDSRIAGIRWGHTQTVDRLHRSDSRQVRIESSASQTGSTSGVV